MTSELNKLSPIRVSGEMIPPPPLFTNIPMLHWILAEVLEDWLRAIGPYQRLVDGANGQSEKVSATVSGFEDLQPVFLKCLFSYAFFFVSADQAYDYLFTDLDRANRILRNCIANRKRPRKTSWVKKIHWIRNNSIAHFPSKRKSVPAIDAFAAMSWQPTSLSTPRSGRPDLEKLTFVPGRFRGKDVSSKSIESRDLEISGIRTLHQHCLSYLEQYDQVCCEYLRELDYAVDS